MIARAGAVAIGVVLAAFAGSSASAARQTTLKVPRDFPTIQRAVEAAPDGATILIAPGVYEEELRIEDKRLDLKGSDEGRTELRSSTRDTGILTYANGGGGEVKNVDFVGGAFGIGGERGVRGELPGPLAIKNVSITGGFRGIYGAFAELSVKSVEVFGTAWNGISLTHIGVEAALQDLEVHDTGSVGLWVNNGGPGDVSIAGHYHHNPYGGVQVSGSNGNVSFFLTVADHNGFYGVALFEGVQAGMALSILEDQRDAPPVYDPSFQCEGVGLLVMESSDISISGTRFEDNCTGLAVAHGASATVTQNVFNSTSPPDEEFVIVDNATGASIVNGGGNVCGFHIAAPNESVVDCSDFVLFTAISPPTPIGGLE